MKHVPNKWAARSVAYHLRIVLQHVAKDPYLVWPVNPFDLETAYKNAVDHADYKEGEREA